MEREALQQMLSLPVGDLTVVQHHATLKAVEQIRSRLRLLVEEEKALDRA